jgi:hypothetical protein
MTGKVQRPSQVPLHGFEPDPDTPLPFTLKPPPEGTAMCLHCRMPGRAGDDRHPDGMLPPPTLPPDLAAAYRAHDNAITGERDDD